MGIWYVKIPFATVEEKLAYISARYIISENNFYKGTPCWEWINKLNTGYPRFKLNNKQSYNAHVEMYKLYKGEIPEGLVVDHLCRNRKCCNPKHLEAVTQQVNVLRGDLVKTIKDKRVATTHCRNGHLRNSENTSQVKDTYLTKDGVKVTSRNRCLLCQRHSTTLRKEKANG